VKAGERRSQLIESIDLYPTLCELAGIPLPEHLEGRSFVELMQNPDADWKTAAVGRFQNGDTIRTERFRFTEYTKPNGEVTSSMLYDHVSDPAENFNVLKMYSPAAAKLSEQLHVQMGRNNE
jgi:arylsulfatase A-like enzyme